MSFVRMDGIAAFIWMTIKEDHGLTNKTVPRKYLLQIALYMMTQFAAAMMTTTREIRMIFPCSGVTPMAGAMRRIIEAMRMRTNHKAWICLLYHQIKNASFVIWACLLSSVRRYEDQIMKLQECCNTQIVM
jgi:hypothetical protein